MLILPLDPLDRVTGSATLLVDEARDIRLLVDCGRYQDGLDAVAANQQPFPFDPARLTAVLLTHAHIDHCGRLPRLVSEGFTGPVICTQETQQIAEMMLNDSARFEPDPQATRAAIRQICWKPLDADRLFSVPLPLGPDLFLFAHRAAHIIGAVSFELVWGPPEDRAAQRRLWLSGDLGNNLDGDEVQPWLRHVMHPNVTADFATLESTYGDRRREDSCPRRRRAGLASLSRSALDRGGPVIIPVFAVQRAQDLLLDLLLLQREHPGVLDGTPVHVHSSMALKVNQVLAEAIERDHRSPRGKVRPAWLSREAIAGLGLDPKVDRDVRAARQILVELLKGPVNRDTPSAGRHTPERLDWSPVQPQEAEGLIRAGGRRIVLATGGMADGGPVVSWLQHNLPHPRATVIFTGWCGPHTQGGRLLRVAGMSPEERGRAPGGVEWGDVRLSFAEIAATICRVDGYSGHADQDRLIRHALPLNERKEAVVLARTIAITHGEPAARRALKERIEAEASRLGLTTRVVLPARAGNGWRVETGEEVERENILAMAGERHAARVQALQHERDEAQAAAQRFQQERDEARRRCAELERALQERNQELASIRARVGSLMEQAARAERRLRGS